MKKRFLHVTFAMLLFLSACGQSNTGGLSGAIGQSGTEEVSTEEGTSTETTELVEVETETERELSVSTRKDMHAASILVTIASLPEEKPESALKQKDVDCDTFQWLTSTYAVYCYHTGRDFHLIGGYSDETEAGYDELAVGLEQSWGITDRASALDSIAWLIVGGHSEGYNEAIQTMEDVGILYCDNLEFETFFVEMQELSGWTDEERTETKYYYQKLREIYEESGKNGIDAWDYSRAMQLCGQSYHLGYITLEEALTIQLEIAQAIQEEYSSWDDWNQSYINGYEYWTYGNSSAASRAWSYQKLTYEEDNPFAILDFNMPLEKFW